MKRLNLSGKTFGYWRVESFSHIFIDKKNPSSAASFWNAVCKCGIKRKVSGTSLSQNKSKSCGCMSVEKLRERSIKKWKEVLNEDGSYNIPLSKNLFAIIDACDLELIKKYSWYPLDNGNGIYAICYRNYKPILMHRLILGLTDSREIDHIDHNRLNNRRNNIRICSLEENRRNTILRKDNKSGYRGVYFRKDQNKYIAQINFKRKSVHLGCFNSAGEAFIVAENKRKELFGEFYNPSTRR